ncbi:thioredoxin family protein [Hansschlegelia plantiphila]|uniref:Thioredoxin domain-containing protein n=1 Tax=Hansschlegelia plantiphila TaxID=374655 RepID=A0A9W6IWS5_9HYPH|nr:hypothetical protein GCM10008179_02090 [Hansschlegelia plantiphila]
MSAGGTACAAFSRRTLLLVCATVLGSASAALAAPPAPFSAAAFDAAVVAGGPVLVHISAPWCPICRAQKPIVAKLLAEPRFGAMTAFDIDFDADKADVRKVGAQLQSTLIVYSRGREVGRSVGEPQPEWIEDLLEKAL